MGGLNAQRPTRPLVIAHRGASGERPENTMPAYDLAVAQRADMIEIDLHRTRDGAIVVAHDERLPGLPEGREIGECTLADVRALATGDTRVPSLDEVLDGFGARIPFNLEIKSGVRVGPYPRIEAEVIAKLASRELGPTILFSSFDDGVLRRLREADRAARIGVLVSARAPEHWLDRCRAVDGEAVHFWKGLATDAAVATAHREGLSVYVYTVDDPDEMRLLLDRGCDGLFTNLPARMRALVETRDPPGNEPVLAE